MTTIHTHIHAEHNDVMKTNGYSSLEKYTSHFIERVVCERELETEQNCNVLTPTLVAITSFLSRSLGLLNRGPGDSVSLGHGPYSSIFSPTATAQSRAWGPPLLGAGSLYRILSPTDPNFLCIELYYCFTPTQFNLSRVKVIPFDTFDRCISYFDCSAGVNMQQIDLWNFRYGIRTGKSSWRYLRSEVNVFFWGGENHLCALSYWLSTIEHGECIRTP